METLEMLTCRPSEGNRSSEGSSKRSSEGKSDLIKGDASQQFDFKDKISFFEFIMHHT